MTQPSQSVPEAQNSQTEIMERDSVPTERGGHYRAILLACVAAMLIFAVSVGADMMLLRDHQPARFTIEISDAISSLVIGLLSYRLFRMQQQRREYIRHKVEVIADMNHHVRNALQIISLTTHGKDKQEIGAIRESVNRIQWALRELLPKI